MFNSIDYMSFAIKEAIKAKNKKEIPVGAIIVDDKGKIIAKAHNLVERNNNSTCHAEKLVIDKALKITGNRYLEKFDIWVTLEPCIMCAGIIKQTRLRRLYFGADDKKGGAVENGPQVLVKEQANGSIDIYSGFSKEKAELLLKDFFRELRTN